MYGFAPYILHVDLSSGNIRKEPLDERLCKEYLGGRGINARLLWDLVPQGADPLGPENVLIIGAGALSGTHAPSSGRTTVTFKSPATNLYAKSSGGGHFGPEMRFAGYNHSVVHGCSQTPVYIGIEDDRVEIRDASHLWGLNVVETDEAIKQELGRDDIETACIGPAGENMVKFAGVMLSVGCAAARAGGGAVMGSKKLKAIVVKGSKSTIKVAEPEKYGKLIAEIIHDLSTYPSRRRLEEIGTSALVPLRNEMHILPTRNYKDSYLEGAYSISGQYIKEAGYLHRRSGCNACATGCHRYTVVDSGPYAGTQSSGPEYETVAALGAGCGVTDTEAVLRANQLCNDYGLDTISTGGVIQWAMECFEKGVITEKDTGGLALNWGDGAALVELVEQIALRQGIGDLLAEGVAKASKQVGQDSWKWAMHVKGLEYSRAEIRARTGYALALAVNPRGADHLHSQVYAEFGSTPEALALIKKICGDEKYADALLPDKRAHIVRWHEDQYAATDCLGVCTFASVGHGYQVTPERLAKLFSYLTGISISEEELLNTGRRIINLEKAFNVREGAARKDDYPAWRFFNEPISSGPYKGRKLDYDVFNRMLDEYYELHGWSVDTGLPTAATLREVGLEDVAVELQKIGRIT